jgi:steroid 5-alpha reductase family enzyme
MYIFVDAIIIVFIYMILLFCLALYKKNNSIIDIGWGTGFMILALYSFFKTHLYMQRHCIVLAMILLWGLRISLHILCRNWGKPEDSRYASMRKKWGKHRELRSFFQIFMLQGIVMLIIAQPIILINSSFENNLRWVDIVGIVVWLVGFVFELVGDYQLQQFLHDKNNHGHILTSGLWRYTRHPNYFGEATMWWGIFLIALSVPHGWTAIMSPATITFLLLYVSGVPLAEASFKGNVEFKKYAQKTSVFFPWFPKK